MFYMRSIRIEFLETMNVMFSCRVMFIFFLFHVLFIKRSNTKNLFEGVEFIMKFEVQHTNVFLYMWFPARFSFYTLFGYVAQQFCTWRNVTPLLSLLGCQTSCAQVLSADDRIQYREGSIISSTLSIPSRSCSSIFELYRYCEIKSIFWKSQA